MHTPGAGINAYLTSLRFKPPFEATLRASLAEAKLVDLALLGIACIYHRLAPNSGKRNIDAYKGHPVHPLTHQRSLQAFFDG